MRIVYFLFKPFQEIEQFVHSKADRIVQQAGDLRLGNPEQRGNFPLFELSGFEERREPRRVRVLVSLKEQFC